MSSNSDFPALDHLEPTKAAGVLSRLILDLESAGLNPAGVASNPAELELRKELLEQAKRIIRDRTHSDIVDDALLIAILDQEADDRASYHRNQVAIDNLGEDGLLTGDMLNVVINNDLTRILNNTTSFDDKMLVKQAVRAPDYTQINPSAGGYTLSSVRLYGKYYNFGGPNDRFLVLVCGCVRGDNFEVSYYARIYESDVNIKFFDDLSTLLSRFAAKYGVRIKVDDFVGKFIDFTLISPNDGERILINQTQNQFIIDGTRLIISIDDPKSVRSSAIVVFLTSTVESRLFLAYGMAIDISKYMHDVEKHLRREKFVVPSEKLPQILGNDSKFK